jgi:hypothetical protein
VRVVHEGAAGGGELPLEELEVRLPHLEHLHHGRRVGQPLGVEKGQQGEQLIDLEWILRNHFGRY